MQACTSPRPRGMGKPGRRAERTSSASSLVRPPSLVCLGHHRSTVSSRHLACLGRRHFSGTSRRCRFAGGGCRANAVWRRGTTHAGPLCWRGICGPERKASTNYGQTSTRFITPPRVLVASPPQNECVEQARIEATWPRFLLRGSPVLRISRSATEALCDFPGVCTPRIMTRNGVGGRHRRPTLGWRRQKSHAPHCVGRFGQPRQFRPSQEGEVVARAPSKDTLRQTLLWWGPL